MNIKQKLKDLAREFILSILLLLRSFIPIAVIAVLVTQFLIINAIVPSPSMEPTVPASSYMFCIRTKIDRSPIERGIIAVFVRNVEDDKVVYTKRVIGLPGETVSIVDGVTYIDGVLLDEPYLKETPKKTNFKFVVPLDSYFCMGDNRNDSFDSRYWEEHFIPYENIIAKGKWFFHSSSDFGFV